ncbi:MAG TPA: AMP-binding protein [Nevskiaceae bacterium]|nr:AMP-binding protein [Nevskiaceae bacterium]
MSHGAAIGVAEPIAGVVYPPPERLRRYVEAGVLPRTTLAEALVQSLARHAARVALHTPQGSMSYAALDARTDRLAAAFLALGLEPLDRVLIQSANHAEVVLALVACFKAGLIPVCTLAAHRESEIGYLGRHTDARLHLVQGDDPKFDLVAFAQRMQPTIPTMACVVAIGGPARADVPRTDDLVERTDAAQARAVLATVPRDPFQAAIFQLSGGTTGVPKVIPRMQNDYLLNAQLTAAHLGYRQDDVLFMPMPMTHNACMMCFLLPLLLTGASFVIPSDNTAEAWAAAFRATPPTVVGMVRALLPRYDQMLGLDATLARDVRLFWAPDASALVRRKYGVLAYPLFGMTEGMNMYTAADDAVEARDETVGRPLSPHDEIRLVEPGTDREVGPGEIGELTVRGPYTIAGYFNTPERNREAFSQDGFYRTGDLMVCRTIGGRPCYAFAGRTKDIVNRGHEKISCEELEQAIVQHPDVADCAAVPMPDPVLGERTCVYVVAKPGRGLPTVAALGEFLQARGLARFKWPERVEAIAALPLTRVGKLDKAALRKRITLVLRDEAATKPKETVS